MGFRFSPPAVRGIDSVETINNLLKVTAGVLQFGGSAVHNTTGDLLNFELDIFDTPGNHFGIFTDALGKGFIAGRNNPTGNPNTYQRIYGSQQTAVNQFSSGSVTTNTANDLTAYSITTSTAGFLEAQFGIINDVSLAKHLLSIDENNIALFMDGSAGETVSFFDGLGAPWLQFDENNSELILGNSFVGFETVIVGHVTTIDSVLGMFITSSTGGINIQADDDVSILAENVNINPTTNFAVTGGALINLAADAISLNLAMTMDITGTGDLQINPAQIGFFGAAPVAQQSANTTAAAVTVADLVTALASWETALSNYGLINFV